MTDRQLTVAVCDDDPMIRRLLQIVLERRGGHRVVLIDDPRLVIGTLVEEQADVLIIDHTMPHQSGPEVIEQIRQHSGLRHLPVAILTGHSDLEDDPEISALDLAAIIVKPFDTSTLPELVESWAVRKSACRA